MFADTTVKIMSALIGKSWRSEPLLRMRNIELYENRLPA